MRTLFSGIVTCAVTLLFCGCSKSETATPVPGDTPPRREAASTTPEISGVGISKLSVSEPVTFTVQGRNLNTVTKVVLRGQKTVEFVPTFTLFEEVGVMDVELAGMPPGKYEVVLVSPAGEHVLKDGVELVP